MSKNWIKYSCAKCGIPLLRSDRILVYQYQSATKPDVGYPPATVNVVELRRGERLLE